jgi:sec-independent protein translocase protein TatA
MADLGWPELSIIVITFVLLFGWKRMPDMARSLGRSARIFTSEVDQLRTDRTDAPSTVNGPSRYAAEPGPLVDAGARADAAEAELASRRADAEVARLRAEREALERTTGSHSSATVQSDSSTSGPSAPSSCSRVGPP